MRDTSDRRPQKKSLSIALLMAFLVTGIGGSSGLDAGKIGRQAGAPPYPLEQKIASILKLDCMGSRRASQPSLGQLGRIS